MECHGNDSTTEPKNINPPPTIYTGGGQQGIAQSTIQSANKPPPLIESEDSDNNDSDEEDSEEDNIQFYFQLLDDKTSNIQDSAPSVIQLNAPVTNICIFGCTGMPASGTFYRADENNHLIPIQMVVGGTYKVDEDKNILKLEITPWQFYQADGSTNLHPMGLVRD
jgi:hypothetical protein